MDTINKLDRELMEIRKSLDLLDVFSSTKCPPENRKADSCVSPLCDHFTDRCNHPDSPRNGGSRIHMAQAGQA